MFRSRFPSGDARRAAASAGERQNPVERMMGTLELVLDAWGVMAPDETQLELAAQGLLRSAVGRPSGRETGVKVVGRNPRTGAVSSVRFSREGISVDGEIPYPLVPDLIARIVG